MISQRLSFFREGLRKIFMKKIEIVKRNDFNRIFIILLKVGRKLMTYVDNIKFLTKVFVEFMPLFPLDFIRKFKV